MEAIWSPSRAEKIPLHPKKKFDAKHPYSASRKHVEHNTQRYARAENISEVNLSKKTFVVQSNNCHIIPQVSQTTSYQMDLFLGQQNIYHIMFFGKKKKRNKKCIPIWSSPSINESKMNRQRLVGSRLLAGQPMKDLGIKNWQLIN